MTVSTEKQPTPERASSFSLDIERQTIPGAFRSYVNRIRSGDPGALPSVLGVVVLVIIFSQASDKFLTRGNIGNLPGQGASIAVIGIGLIFVLLLGEIDLSAATTGGMAAGFAATGIFQGNLKDNLASKDHAYVWWGLVAFMILAIALGVLFKLWTGTVAVAVGLVILVFNLEQHVFPAIVMAVCIGAAVGIFIGFVVAKVGIPSFIATLALFLAWQGVLLFAISSQSINIDPVRFKLWYNLTHKNLSTTTSWIFAIIVVALFAAYTLTRSIRAQRAGLAHDALELVLLRLGIVAVVVIVLTVLANQNRNPGRGLPNQGIPVAAVLVIVLMVITSLMLSKTTWGRHLYAVGGNEEAARRAGIDVVHMKMTAFTLCSAFGGLGGILLSSSQFSVSLDLGGGNNLLFSVAAAVIGGASLFGGRGRPRDAVIGALVIVIIPNGLSLQRNLGPEYADVITGIVLLAAASVDAISRKRGKRS